MGRRPAGSPGTKPLAELARAWAEESCAAQGVPVKVADRNVLARVGTLLGIVPGQERLDAPKRREAAGVEAVVAASAGGDDDVVEEGGDDRVLPGQR